MAPDRESGQARIGFCAAGAAVGGVTTGKVERRGRLVNRRAGC